MVLALSSGKIQKANLGVKYGGRVMSVVLFINKRCNSSIREGQDEPQLEAEGRVSGGESLGTLGKLHKMGDSQTE